MLPKVPCLPVRLERLALLREALAVPEDAMTVVREILRFLVTERLILAAGVLLWMVGQCQTAMIGIWLEPQPSACDQSCHATSAA